MNLSPEFIVQVLVAIGGIGATYAAIRGDLAKLHERTINTQKSADRAHSRIDSLLHK